MALNAPRNLLAVRTLIEMPVKVHLATRRGQSLRPTARWLAGRLEELGPTYMKLGQFVSSRGDIFGEDFSDELKRLCARAAHVDRVSSDAIISEFMKANPEVEHVDAAPLATASIGQVHRGRLKSGKHIAIKFKKPGVDESVTNDLALLKAVAGTMERLKVTNSAGLVKIVNDVERSLVSEIDFVAEARSMEEFAAAYANYEGVRIPRVLSAHSDRRWIVMEYVASSRLAFDSEVTAKGFVRKLMTFFVHQMLEVGLLHGDPHSGNVGRTKSGKVILYDCGNIVRLTERERCAIKELVCLLIVRNKYGVSKLLPTLGIKVTDPKDVPKFIDTYIEYMETIDYTKLKPLYETTRDVPIRLEGRVLQVIKAFGALEGLCKELDPDFNYFQLLDAYMGTSLMDEDFLIYKIARDLKQLSRMQETMFTKMLEERHLDD